MVNFVDCVWALLIKNCNYLQFFLLFHAIVSSTDLLWEGKKF